MTADEFRILLRDQTNEQLLGSCLHDDHTPFVFDPKPTAWDTFRDELGSSLGVAKQDIRIVGSARFGFSMRPGRNLKRFEDTSDIDVVVVNAHVFDELWLSLLTAVYPRGQIAGRIGGWLKVRRNEVYTGWLTPLEIRLDASIVGERAKPVLQFGARWFDAFKRVGRHTPRRHEGINSRLYRTWRHAEMYHASSLSALRSNLQQQIT